MLERLGLLRQRDYLRYWSASTISLFGTQVSQIAIPVIAVLLLDATPFEVGLLATVEMLPWILFTLPAGVWVDRLPRRRILVGGDLGRAIVLGSIPVAWAFGVLTIWQLYLVGFANGILTVFFDVADQSYLPTVVDRDELVEGNAKLQVSASAAQILGQPIGGTIVALASAPFAVTVDAISYIGSATLISRVRRVEAPRVPSTADGSATAPARSGMRTEMAEGLRYVLGNPILRSIAACTGSSNLGSNIVFAVFAVYVYRDLGLSPAAIGLVGGISGFGILAGALLANRLATRFGVGRTIVGSALLYGPAGLLIPLAPADRPIPFFAAAMFLSGGLAIVYNVNQVSLRQAITPERLLGRLNGTMRFLVWGTMPIGALLGGVLATVFGVHEAIWIGSIIQVFTFLPLLFSPVPGVQRMPTQAVDEIPSGTSGVGAPAAELAGGAIDELARGGAIEPATYPDPD
ncbi:MAG TPA: MFS transporter [Candidatus Binatia bacterium]|nr:MFS transporter [Candidatus Binatia bacterium]